MPLFTNEVESTDLDVRDLVFATDKVDVSGSTSVGVTGPLTDTQLRATPVPVSATDLDIRNLVFATDKVDATGSAVTVTGTVATTVGGTALATVTSVGVSTTVATLSASNAAKTKVAVHNEGGTLFVKLGTGASSTSYSYRLTANTNLEIEGYTGIVTATKLTGTTNALVTEYGI